MFISTDLYLKRLMGTLEQVVAPEIESDNVRGQVFAIVDLMKQMADRIEYKQSLISHDVEIGLEAIRRIVASLNEAGLEASGELCAFLQECDEGKAGKGLPLRNKVEEMFSAAINCFHEKRGKLSALVAEEIDAAIRESITKIAGRDLGLMKPPAIEKISRSKR